MPPTPKLSSPLTPSRERRRAPLRKLNSLSSGIRGLQAKLHVLREETSSNISDAGEDVIGFGSDLLVQFESIGDDLKALMQEWEDAKAALASNLDRNEKRYSSISGLLSPTTSLSGRTAVDDGSTPESNRDSTLETGHPTCDFSSSDAEEVFEAVALSKPRSTLTREERIDKMRQERARMLSIREKSDASTHMLRELQTVISLRPRVRTNPPARVTSL